jgi:hypothetical protein
MKGKTNAQIFVEQSEYLKKISVFWLGHEKEVDIAYINDDGCCELNERVLTPEQALELAAWLVETFKI